MRGESSVEELLLGIVRSTMEENNIKDNNGLYKKIVASLWNKEPVEVCENLLKMLFILLTKKN
jgi:hypothetical protein